MNKDNDECKDRSKDERKYEQQKSDNILKDAGSIPAEGGPSPNQGAHSSVGRGLGSSYAANIPATGPRDRPADALSVASTMAQCRIATTGQKADPATLRDNR
uniref:Uncharacterized protein n=1 Tax=Plectus sambesii TaxID=2011161 RepID=A0A914VZV6_9BILA